MMEPHKTRVLVVEDSPVVQTLWVQLLQSDPRFDVVGRANNGEEAIALAATCRPDVILMDVYMPKMDGIEATRRIMESQPVPIVVASATRDSQEVPLAFRAMEAGALAFVDKSARVGTPQFEEQARQLKQMLKLMSEIKVVRRWNRAPPASPGAAPTVPTAGAAPRGVKLVAIGASTGGPPVLQTILARLPRGFALPLLIVQHITPGFLNGLGDWLTQTTSIPTHIAAQGQEPLPGHAYLAPDDFHMGLQPNGRIALDKSEREYGLRPSVGHLFRSVAEVLGAKAVGVLLTGMGKDGAAELRLLKQRGALTLVQDRDTSVVHGMPGEAVAIGAASYVLSPDKIADALGNLAPSK